MRWLKQPVFLKLKNDNTEKIKYDIIANKNKNDLSNNNNEKEKKSNNDKY